MLRTAFALSMLLMASLTSAGMVTDVVNQSERLGWFDSYSYTHNLNDEGFTLGSAVSGLLDVEIQDDSDRGWWIWHLELSALNIEGGWVGVTAGNSFNNVQISGQALASINQDGLLDVTIQSLWGDFYVGDSTLTITTDDGLAVGSAAVANVPEPGLLMLLAVGMVGLGVARSRS